MTALIGPLGPLELGIILIIVFVIFGAKRLPELGSSLGSGMRNFKDSVTGEDAEPPAAEIEPAMAVVPPVGASAPTEPQPQSSRLADGLR